MRLLKCLTLSLTIAFLASCSNTLVLPDCLFYKKVTIADPSSLTRSEKEVIVGNNLAFEKLCQ